MSGKVIIHEMVGEEGLYSLHFEGSAEDYGFSEQSDYLSAEEAHEYALDVSYETYAEIVWEGYKPSWA